MKKLLVLSLVAVMSFFAFSGQKSKKVAIVKVVKGKASMLALDGSAGAIKKGMWLTEGAIIKTSARSFVRLSFIDKSSMNIGPKSELKIEKFSKSEAGVINLLTGKIRSKVTKDYLKMDKDKSKLFVKSRNAVMGVRGTDFMFTANKKTGSTTTVLFEGSIVFNKFKKGDNLRNLEGIVSQGRKIKPGEVSVVNRKFAKPTVGAKLSSRQFNQLNKNKNFEVSAKTEQTKSKSMVPPGLSGNVVANDNASLKDEIKKLIKVDVKDRVIAEGDQVKPEVANGFVHGDDVKPADGVQIHIDTGTLIPPGLDSTFDKNVGEWVSATNGGSSSNGEYLPPQGFQINEEGQFLKVDIETGAVKGVVVLEIKPVDQVKPIDLAPVMKYIPPKEPVNGPVPAGMKDSPMDPAMDSTMDSTMNEFNQSFDATMQEEFMIEEQIKQEFTQHYRDNVGDFPVAVDPDVFDMPPLPVGTSFVPPTHTDTTGGTTTTNTGRTKVNIKVNKPAANN
ncbi:MAG: FecR domain-containing protein [Halobacteriovoraceae bacterium]|jgi:hypothetical protein|nr:FecR domain-containing protein [Halobacteriovoraceae bacterium]